MPFTELYGHIVTSVALSDGEHVLCFTLNDMRKIFYVVRGDCCSESWFSDITGLSAFAQGARVLDAYDVALPAYLVEDGRARQDVESVYGSVIRTTQGRVSIVFRNSSNGYYGGWMEHTDAHTLDPHEVFRQITTDYPEHVPCL